MGIKEDKKGKKNGGKSIYHPCPMLKFIIYAKIDYIEIDRFIVEITKCYDIYKLFMTELIHQNIQYKGLW